MALGAKVIDFVRLNGPNDPIERTGIVEVAINEPQSGLRNMRILIDPIDAAGVERA